MECGDCAYQGTHDIGNMLIEGQGVRWGGYSEQVVAIVGFVPIVESSALDLCEVVWVEGGHGGEKGFHVWVWSYQVVEGASGHVIGLGVARTMGIGVCNVLVGGIRCK